jgi:hypothetical protein
MALGEREKARRGDLNEAWLSDQIAANQIAASALDHASVWC